MPLSHVLPLRLVQKIQTTFPGFTPPVRTSFATLPLNPAPFRRAL